MMANKFLVTFDIEPIVKLYCKNRKCRFNMYNGPVKRAFYCTLKHIEISDTGACYQCEENENDNPT